MKLYCNIFGHNFEVSKKITYHVKEYKCTNCSKELTTGSKGYLVNLTNEHREINSVLSKVHLKKQDRLRNESLDITYRMTS